MLENMGLRGARRAAVRDRAADGQDPVWIHDFGLRTRRRPDVDRAEVRERLPGGVRARVWRGEVENDGFNRLVLGPASTLAPGRRAARLLQVPAADRARPSARRYMEQTLAAQPADRRAGCVELFDAPLRPGARPTARSRGPSELRERLADGARRRSPTSTRTGSCAASSTWSQATLRTNAFQPTPDGEPKPYLSFKLDPAQVPTLPAAAADVRDLRLLAAHRGRPPARRQGRPRRHPLVRPPRGLPHRDPGPDEGADGQERGDRAGGRQGRLRGQAAAGRRRPRGAAGRGRRLLPTMPARAARHHRQPGRRQGRPAAPTSCATTTTTPTWWWRPTRARPPSPTSPTRSPRSTASGSDDAFASGGSAGYDHKKMGITARGAWESVKRHFRELGVDTQRADFTVVGIGDMSGDVFGNGMLLSPPHPAGRRRSTTGTCSSTPIPTRTVGFAERERLFALPRSSLGRLRPAKISDGRRRLAAHAPRRSRCRREVRAGPGRRGRARSAARRADQRDPQGAGRPALERRHRHLREGGRARRHADVGDRANDAIRVERRATCAARSWARAATSASPSSAASSTPLRGGRINTDFIDNSAGVDCSDHEVNIKILLDGVVDDGEMTRKQRDKLLAEMTDEVGRAGAAGQLPPDAGAQRRPRRRAPQPARRARPADAHTSSAPARLDRALEFLPDDEELAERGARPARA